MSPLEQRYRRLLQWLPEPARSRWADDMTETYLSVTTADDPEYADFGSPTPADRLDVARLALRLRLGAPGASVRAVAAGHTLRLVAVAGSTALATLALVGLASTAWLHDVLPFASAPELDGALLWGPSDAAGVVLEGLLVAVAFGTVRGLAAARPLAALALVLQVGLSLASVVRPLDLLPVVTMTVPLAAAALLPAGTPVRRPWWLLAFPAATLATWPVALLLDRPPDWLFGLSDPVVHWGLLAALAGVVLLARRRSSRGPAELAVAVLAVATLPGFAGRWSYDLAGYHAVVVAALFAAVATAVVTGTVGLRALTALPADAAADTEHP